MAYSEELAARVGEVLQEEGDLDERKMFGGLAFMVKGHMCCGVVGDDLMLRLGAEGAAAALADKHVRPMDFTGRPMKAYVFVAAAGIKTEQSLRTRLQPALDFVATLPPK